MSAESIAARFAAHVEAELLHRSAGDRFEAEGRARLEAAAARFVARGQTIELLLPGFPHKNPNRAKTLGPLPDLGETLALERLAEFARGCDAWYRVDGGAKPACRVTIFSDGRVWGDLLGVPMSDCVAYGEGLRAIPAVAPHVAFADLDAHAELLPGDPSEPVIARVERAWESPEAVEALDRALGHTGDAPNPDRVRVFERFTRLIREDRPWAPERSEAEIMEVCRSAARRMMLRHAAFTGLLAQAYPEHIRLSVHASSNQGAKFSARLYPGIDRCVLPYHNVVVSEPDGSDFTLMPRADAEALPGGVEVVFNTRRPWCLRRRLPSVE